MKMKNKFLYESKKLPFYLRLSDFIEGKNSSIVCVLNSKPYQTDQYNKKRFYKPILINNKHVGL